ncbi:zinc ABC transporter substrate-binding protein [Intrasporangium mesophilum]
MTLHRPARLLAALAAGAAIVGASAACDSAASSPEGAIVTSFYPIQFAAQQITGGALPVSVLTKPGAEPHDLELTPQDVAGMTKARLVVYADGFQPAVDDAMVQVDPSAVLDVAGAADLDLTGTDEHEGETADEHAEHDHAGADPHFWLDPQRYAAVAKAIGARLSQVDPANAATYAKNTEAFVDRLTALDTDLTRGLQTCRSHVLVTSHAAFGYLAERYGLEQHGITGVSPDAEPSAAALKQVADLVRAEGVTTIFQETLVEPHLAQTVATTTGATLATLDPVEGITDASAGKDYFEVMHSNLAALQKGLGCQ